MAPKRKNARTIRTKKPTTPSSTVFFNHPDEKPYGVFCRWKASPINIPISILQTIADQPSASAILADYGTSIAFSCAEPPYMFLKALYFRDAESCRAILATTDPAEQKKLDKNVKGFSDEGWDIVKSRVARVGNWYKSTHPENINLREILLGMEDMELAEAGRRDGVWGIGYQAHEAERYGQRWGENKLGKVLMAVRARNMEVTLREVEMGLPDDWMWDGGKGDDVDEAELRVWTLREEDEDENSE